MTQVSQRPDCRCLRGIAGDCASLLTEIAEAAAEQTPPLAVAVANVELAALRDKLLDVLGTLAEANRAVQQPAAAAKEQRRELPVKAQTSAPCF